MYYRHIERALFAPYPLSSELLHDQKLKRLIMLRGISLLSKDSSEKITRSSLPLIKISCTTYFIVQHYFSTRNGKYHILWCGFELFSCSRNLTRQNSIENRSSLSSDDNDTEDDT